MACSTTLLGVSLDCGNVGGLKKVYLAPIEDVTGITISSGMTTAVTMTSGKKFKEFSFRKGNANFVSTGTRNDQAGTSYFSTVLTAQFNKMETVKRTEMQALATGQVYIIAQDQNDLYWLIGYGSYGSSAVNGQSGAAMGDGNFYTLTITSETTELPYEVQSSVISGII